MKYEITSDGHKATLLGAVATFTDSQTGAQYNARITSDYPDENGEIFAVVMYAGSQGEGEHVNMKDLSRFRKTFPGDARPKMLDVRPVNEDVVVYRYNSKAAGESIERRYKQRWAENRIKDKQLDSNELLAYILDARLDEKSPPGWSGSVAAMLQHHPELSKGKTKDGKKKNPWALAWHLKNKGAKSHYKKQPEDDSQSKAKPAKKKKYKEWLKERDENLYKETYNKE